MAIWPSGPSPVRTVYKSLHLSSNPIPPCSLSPKLQTQRTEEKQTNKNRLVRLKPGNRAAAIPTTQCPGRARPNAIAPEPASTAATSSHVAKTDGPHHHEDEDLPAVLTVWRKSLLPSCSGFTVFDSSGALAFRVDCYAGSARRGLLLWRRPRAGGEVVLMDVAGAPLLTVRRQSSRLASLGLAPDRWLVFHGDAAGRRRPDKAEPFLSVRRARRALGLLGESASSAGKAAPLAYVTPLLQAAAGGGSSGEAYVVEGSYGARACAVRDARSGDAVAEVRRKERVGDDVFRLVAAPSLGAPLAMALVIALDEMFATGGVSGSESGSGSAWRPSLLRRTWSA